MKMEDPKNYSKIHEIRFISKFEHRKISLSEYINSSDEYFDKKYGKKV